MIRVLTAGESHGKAIVVIVEGLPYGIKIDIDNINKELKRRQAGYGRGKRMNIEKDRVEVLSGVRGGITLGSPIALLIKNLDYEKWERIMDIKSAEGKTVTVPRPGHADLPGVLKVGAADIRDILERSSARETAARVAAGGLFKIFLKNFNIRLYSHTISIGNISIKNRELSLKEVEKTVLRCTDSIAEKNMIALIDTAKKEGDSLGGISEIIAENVPVGLGSYTIFDRRLDSKIGELMLSIPSVKGVEIGPAFDNTKLKASEVHDAIYYNDRTGFFRKTNKAGGIEGGMSTGNSIIVRIAVKPIPTLINPLISTDIRTKKQIKAHIERSDVCIVPAAGVIGEAMLSFALADKICEKFGCDNIDDIKKSYKAYLRRVKNG